MSSIVYRSSVYGVCSWLRCPLAPIWRCYGERVRPLPRRRQGKILTATPPDATAQGMVAGWRIWAQVWDHLVLADAKLDVHFTCPAPVPSWERRAPARLRKPRWSVALPGKTLGNWQWRYETDL